MIVTAHLQSLRIAPRKVRLMANVMKGMDAVSAKHQLRYFPKRSSRPLEKLLDSALANAQNTFGLVKENMKIKDVMVNGGSVLKRFEPKGFGSASPLAKRTSHVTIILEEKVVGLKADKAVVAKKKSDEESHEGHDHKHDAKPEIKKELGKKDAGVKNTKRRLFQRKSV